MSLVYSLDEEEKSQGDSKLPSLEHDVTRAKMFLQKHSPASGECLYDHLAELLERILSERPTNAVDVFEDYSKKLKDERYKGKTNYLREDYVAPVPCEEAKKLMRLYQNSKDENNVEDELEDEDRDDDPKRASPDLLELFFHLEQIDVGLPRLEIVALNFSIRKLVADKPIQNVRFWGKIIGKPKNYYIVEAELLDEELLARRTAAADAGKIAEEYNETNPNDNEKRTVEDEEKDTTKIQKDEETSSKLQLTFPPLPMNVWKEKPIVPIEEIGHGTNAHVYFVCNSPGLDDWTELPLVTPQQIDAARRIARTFTGQLDTPIHTFPSFPGTERNYLRAQIARISAATLVSPIGFFTFAEAVGEEDDEEEADTEVADEEDAAGTGAILENRHYVPPSLKELIDPATSNWCHHRPYILEQGRTVWWDPRKKESRENEDETDLDEEEVEDEEDEQEDNNEDETRGGELKKEIGPPLLTPLSEDGRIGTIVAWTARASSIIKSNRATIAILRSNAWPGSFTFATGKRFASVYIGTGQKFNPCNYSPPDLPMIQEQYIIGPEVMEIQDPSFEAEEAYRVAHLPPSKPELLGEEDEDEDEEDDDDEDDED